MRIAVDCGHCLSGYDTGARGCGFKEEEKTREIGTLLTKKLRALGHSVVDVTVDNSKSLNESLSTRSTRANKENVELGISIHLNAFNGQAYGVESLIYNKGGKSEVYAGKIQAELVKLGYRDRGVKVQDLHMVRETVAPWVLVECGFIDNPNDMKIYNAEKISNAICLGITGKLPVESPAGASTSKMMYRVVTGSFGNRDNANKRVAELKVKNFDSFLLAEGSNFRVITGSFGDKANADKRVSELKAKGFNSFIAIY